MPTAPYAVITVPVACPIVVAGANNDDAMVEPNGSTDGAPVSVIEQPASGLRRRWLLFFIALFPLTAMWSLTNPMFASPDETVHMVRAQSFARGDFSVPFTTDGLPIESVECFRFRPDITADCQDLTWGRDGTQRVTSTDGYPPLFHAVASIPAIFVSGLTGAYLMRLWTAAVVVALFAWAGALITRQNLGPLPLGAFVLALTPTATLVSSTVSPSGLSMATATLFVAGLLSWHIRRCVEPTAVVAIVVGACGLALGRRDGILWLAALSLCLLPVLWPRLVGGVRHRRAQFLSGGIVVALVAIGVIAVWGRTTIERFARNGLAGGGTDAWEALRYVRSYLYEMFGVFGWLDTTIGEEAFLFAIILYGLVIMLGLFGTDRRLSLSTGLALAALLVSPVAIGLVSFPYLQGRYLLPMFAGLMLVAGVSAAFGETGQRFNRQVTRAFLIGWAGVQLIAGVQNLRRYAVGSSGSWQFVVDAAWHPVTMSNAAAVFLFVVAVGVALVVFRIVLREVSPAPCGSGSTPTD